MGTKGSRYSGDIGEFADDLVGALSSLGDISWKKMFGGAGIFVDGSMFALIDPEARLHLKVDDRNREQFEAAGSNKHARMPYYEVPAEVLGDDASLLAWAQESADIAR